MRRRAVVAEVEWHLGELYPCVGFIVTNLSRPAERVVGFCNQRGRCEQWIKGGKGASRGRRSPIAVTFITRSSNDNGDVVAAAPCHRRPAVAGAAWAILMKEVGTLDKFGDFRWRRSNARLGRLAGRSFDIGRRGSDSRISRR